MKERPLPIDNSIYARPFNLYHAMPRGWDDNVGTLWMCLHFDARGKLVEQKNFGGFFPARECATYLWRETGAEVLLPSFMYSNYNAEAIKRGTPCISVLDGNELDTQRRGDFQRQAWDECKRSGMCIVEPYRLDVWDTDALEWGLRVRDTESGMIVQRRTRIRASADAYGRALNDFEQEDWKLSVLCDQLSQQLRAVDKLLPRRNAAALVAKTISKRNRSCILYEPTLRTTYLYATAELAKFEQLRLALATLSAQHWTHFAGGWNAEHERYYLAKRKRAGDYRIRFILPDDWDAPVVLPDVALLDAVQQRVSADARDSVVELNFGAD